MNIYLPESLYNQLNDPNIFKGYITKGWKTKPSQEIKTDTLQRNFRESCYIICHIILMDIAMGQTKEGKANTSFNQHAAVDSRELNYYVRRYKDMLDFLKAKNIIGVLKKKGRESYSAGNNGFEPMAKRYYFIGELEGQKLVAVPIKGKIRLKKLTEKRLNRTYQNKKEEVPLTKALLKYRDILFSRISLNADKAIEYAIDKYERGGYDKITKFYRAYAPVFRFRTSTYFQLEPFVCRLHHSFTGLNNDYRQFLVFDKVEGQKLVEVDVSACNPFLLAAHLWKEGNRDKNLDTFFNLTVKQDFYTEIFRYCIQHTPEMSEVLKSKYFDSEGGVNRKAVKTSINKFFNRTGEANRTKGGEAETTFYKVLFQHFPTVFYEVERLNAESVKEGHGLTGVYDLLTGLESGVTIDYVVPRILKKGILAITRHDGIICLEKDAKAIEDLMVKGFEEIFGEESPVIKIKSIKQEVSI
ncbi:hypothetical protein ACFSC6_00025 [Rufibacter sediminis]|uniref:hypothetical protein n=1 Tax=Rufibacter sediminis TaxID=2762756 RepID=UPI0021095B6C|nr:hypothetical protein [Rufibacter sediminis]